MFLFSLVFHVLIPGLVIMLVLMVMMMLGLEVMAVYKLELLYIGPRTPKFSIEHCRSEVR